MTFSNNLDCGFCHISIFCKSKEIFKCDEVEVKNSMCTSKIKECHKVKNLIKDTLFKLHSIH